jgi:archaeal flagellin FlaB
MNNHTLKCGYLFIKTNSFPTKKWGVSNMSEKKIGVKGMMGIGTLIIFIAVILVSAVAAAVLVATSGSLQQRSLLTGQQAEEGIATGAEVIGVSASNASGDYNIEEFEVLLRLQAGSGPLNFNNTLLMVDTSTRSYNMDYSGSSTEWSSGTTTGQYAIEYVKQGGDYVPGYLSRGDVAKMRFNVSESIPENKRIRMKIVPRVGVTTVIELTTPDVMTDQRILLWP